MRTYSSVIQLKNDTDILLESVCTQNVLCKLVLVLRCCTKLKRCIPKGELTSQFFQHCATTENNEFNGHMEVLGLKYHD